MAQNSFSYAYLTPYKVSCPFRPLLSASENVFRIKRYCIRASNNLLPTCATSYIIQLVRQMPYKSEQSCLSIRILGKRGCNKSGGIIFLFVVIFSMTNIGIPTINKQVKTKRWKMGWRKPTFCLWRFIWKFYSQKENSSCVINFRNSFTLWDLYNYKYKLFNRVYFGFNKKDK